MVEKSKGATKRHLQFGTDPEHSHHHREGGERKEKRRRRRREDGWYVQYFDDQTMPVSTARFPDMTEQSQQQIEEQDNETLEEQMMDDGDQMTTSELEPKVTTSD